MAARRIHDLTSENEALGEALGRALAAPPCHRRGSTDSQLQEENEALSEALAGALAAAATVRSQAERVTEVEADNSALRQEVARLKRQLKETTLSFLVNDRLVSPR